MASAVTTEVDLKLLKEEKQEKYD